MELAKSLASLVKYNNGKFKSPKQAEFFLSKCPENVYRDQQSFQFGEYQTVTRRNTATITREYHLDSEGVTSAIKVSSKGEQIVFNRLFGDDLVAYNDNLAKQAKRKSAIQHINHRREQIQAIIEHRSTLVNNAAEDFDLAAKIAQCAGAEGLLKGVLEDYEQYTGSMGKSYSRAVAALTKLYNKIDLI